ncbi:hypothetical protein Pcinc_026950 [Petrolisthes cinctipes]|uniref:Palmitoyltransferase n=1 Tax=Petrolisthes cinctipes TaxID=88211 RepID=A0AAE1KBI9_PETCI|nr:hypothetical protein Pcinc_026950 [Petrolisthes cinctipes]
MPEHDDDSALCCCEYINEDGERSHLLATLCNCDAVDEGFDRLVTRRTVGNEHLNRIMDTISDRLRIPWYGGARKLPLDVTGAVLCVCITLLLGCFTWTTVIVTYTVFLPALLYTIHRFIRRKVVHEGTSTYNIDGSNYVKKYPRSKFYFAWLVVSLVVLLTIYYTQVITRLKISPVENLIFMFLACVSCTSLYLVRATSCAGFESPSKSGQETYGEVIESGAWRVCGQCERQVPRQASHCRTCDACYFLRDHHCLWLDVCVSQVNDRWFVSGLLSGALALWYGSHLSFTTVCHPRLINLYLTTMLFPHQCPNAFVDFQSSLTVSGACYGLLLATLVSVALTQQLVCIACGVRLREYRQRRHIPGGGSPWSPKYILKNCLNFWWR